MDHKVEITKAVHADLPSISELFNQYRVFYGKPPDIAAAGEFLRLRLEAGESVLFQAVVNGRSAGFVQLYPSFSSVSLKRIWILNDLFVDPGFRKNGVGRALMEAAGEFAKATGAKGLALETTPDNRIGQALYESLGYERDTTLHYFLEV